MDKENNLPQNDEENKPQPPDEKNKYLKISFTRNSRVVFYNHNIIQMPADFDAFKNKLVQLYAIKEGVSFDCRIDEYHVNLPGDYEIIRDHGRVDVVCCDNSWRCAII